MFAKENTPKLRHFRRTVKEAAIFRWKIIHRANVKPQVLRTNVMLKLKKEFLSD